MPPHDKTVVKSVLFPQEHHELQTVGRKSIYAFLQERNLYERRAENEIAQGSTLRPVRLVYFVDVDILTSLVDFDTFPGVTAVNYLDYETLLWCLRVQVEYKLDVYTKDELAKLVKNLFTYAWRKLTRRSVL